MVNKKKVEVYGIVQDMAIKLLFSLVMLAMVIIMTIQLVKNPTSWPLAGANTGFSTILAIVLRHYFPRRDSSGD
jgi:hypothetical protein